MLRVNAAAYEDFLQSAEASIEGLVERGSQASETGTVDAAAALHAANASHRLGAANFPTLSFGPADLCIAGGAGPAFAFVKFLEKSYG